jgi:hypothetical protein
MCKYRTKPPEIQPPNLSRRIYSYRSKSHHFLIRKIDFEHYLAQEKAVDAMPRRTMETTSIAGNGEDLH